MTSQQRQKTEGTSHHTFGLPLLGKKWVLKLSVQCTFGAVNSYWDRTVTHISLAASLSALTHSIHCFTTVSSHWYRTVKHVIWQLTSLSALTHSIHRFALHISSAIGTRRLHIMYKSGSFTTDVHSRLPFITLRLSTSIGTGL